MSFGLNKSDVDYPGSLKKYTNPLFLFTYFKLF